MQSCILHLITGLDVGGAELALYRLLSGLSEAERQSHRVVSLIAPGEVGQMIAALGVKVDTLGLGRGRLSLGAVFRLRKMLAGQKALVHGWMYHADLLATLAAPRRHIWSIHNGLDGLASEKPLTRLIIRWLARLSFLPRKIVYVGTRTAFQHERIGYRREKTTIIPHGFDISQYQPDAAAKLRLREELGLSSATKIIGLLGRWDWSKDIPTFLAALAKVPEVHAVLAGNRMDGNNPELTELVERHGVRERVHLLGYRRDVPALLPGFDLLCMCSKTEAGPMVVGEAMACGVPCVVTDVGDAAHMTEETGWVVEKENPVALAAALRAALVVPDLPERGARARARIEAQFTAEATVSAYQRLYAALK
jgi:glycosyltransferase involved in cell wall biosynthesis